MAELDLKLGQVSKVIRSCCMVCVRFSNMFRIKVLVRIVVGSSDQV